MSKANQEALENLHALLAEVLISQISHTVEETTFDLEGNEVPTGKTIFTASPATMAAAIKFLKDNEIKRDEEVKMGANELREALQQKQKHSRIQSVQ